MQTHSEIIQTTSDLVNIPDSLSYGTISEELLVAGYNARNGNRVTQKNYWSK